MSNGLPEILRVDWQRTWMETGHKRERKKWSECCDKPRRDKRREEGTGGGPSTTRSLDHWWLLQPRGHENGLESPNHRTQALQTTVPNDQENWYHHCCEAVHSFIKRHDARWALVLNKMLKWVRNQLPEAWGNACGVFTCMKELREGEGEKDVKPT